MKMKQCGVLKDFLLSTLRRIKKCKETSVTGSEGVHVRGDVVQRVNLLLFCNTTKHLSSTLISGCKINFLV